MKKNVLYVLFVLAGLVATHFVFLNSDVYPVIADVGQWFWRTMVQVGGVILGLFVFCLPFGLAGWAIFKLTNWQEQTVKIWRSNAVLLMLATAWPSMMASVWMLRQIFPASFNSDGPATAPTVGMILWIWFVGAAFELIAYAFCALRDPRPHE